MKTFVYLRVSTEKQTFAQQMNTISDYLKLKGLHVDEVVSDEGVSGGVSYKQRKLNDLIQEMNVGDALVVSEISRLGRSMSDLNKLVNDELKPRKLRLIIISMGLDLDCSNLKAIDEMILFAFSFSSQIEKEMIQERTKSALDARKKEIEKNGFFVSKKGNVCHRLGGNGDTSKAVEASKQSRRTKAMNNPNNKTFWEFIQDYQMIHGKLDANSDFQPVADELNRRGKTTATGLEFDKLRTRLMFYKCKKMFNE